MTEPMCLELVLGPQVDTQFFLYLYYSCLDLLCCTLGRVQIWCTHRLCVVLLWGPKMLQLEQVTSLAKSSLPAQAPSASLCLSVLQPRQSKNNGVPRPARLQLETSTRPRPLTAW